MFALTISYMIRFSFSLVITALVPPGTSNKVDPNACPEFGDIEESTEKDHKYLYNWDEHTQGIILSSFFLGYFAMQVPGGVIADHVGAYIVLVITMLLSSICTFLTPFSIFIGDWPLLIVVRVCLGLAQGVFYVSLHCVVSTWIPKEERGFWGTIVFMGAQVGNFLSMLITGQLIGWLGATQWPMVFYLYGGVGLLWILIFILTTYSTPTKHPKLKSKEKEILANYIEDATKVEAVQKTPYKAVFKSLPVWAIVLANVGHDWGMYTLSVDLPKYMKSVMRFNIKQNGIYSALGYLMIMGMAVISGYVVDYLEKKEKLSLTLNRILFTTLGSVGPSVGMVLSAYAGCNRTLAMIYLISGMAWMGTYFPSLKVNPIDLAPNHSGFVGAVGGVFGSVAGMIVPYLIGVLTPNGFLEEWRLVFWITFGVMSLTNIFYIFFATAKIQPWNSEGSEGGT